MKATPGFNDSRDAIEGTYLPHRPVRDLVHPAKLCDDIARVYRLSVQILFVFFPAQTNSTDTLLYAWQALLHCSVALRLRRRVESPPGSRVFTVPTTDSTYLYNSMDCLYKQYKSTEQKLFYFVYSSLSCTLRIGAVPTWVALVATTLLSR